MSLSLSTKESSFEEFAFVKSSLAFSESSFALCSALCASSKEGIYSYDKKKLRKERRKGRGEKNTSKSPSGSGLSSFFIRPSLAWRKANKSAGSKVFTNAKYSFGRKIIFIFVFVFVFFFLNYKVCGKKKFIIFLKTFPFSSIYKAQKKIFNELFFFCKFFFFTFSRSKLVKLL